MSYAKHQSRSNRYIRYHSCVNFYSLFSFWTACDAPSIEQSRYNMTISSSTLLLTSRTYILHTTNRRRKVTRVGEQNTLISTTVVTLSHREKPLILSITNQNNNNQVHLGPVTTYVHIYSE